MNGTVRAMVSGYVATKVMTAAMYDLLPGIGLARVDVAGALNRPGEESEGGRNEKLDEHQSREKKQPGLFIHYLLGTLIFPLSYQLLFRSVIPGNRLSKGLIWGLCLWAVGQSVVFPMLGKEPLFKRKKSAGLNYLLSHVVYGTAFGLGAGGRGTRSHR
ncbi:MAG TPA: DUF6789 family protein [Planktothrix sp.]|jgi:hypothetical protein